MNTRSALALVVALTAARQSAAGVEEQAAKPDTPKMRPADVISVRPRPRRMRGHSLALRRTTALVPQLH